eukprot:CAMPEP_0197655064 /NCGR_PEP_ID=MMETSP1338-20131121/39228_1 /TAXON_ID=43686 ORGANISM="Pelagodinium beii, Strain RCC1491" /NCGR_SAMPLE_ID=MMETSP1338 /ASSEMBLY_ACC=CAM_ASM_000754 /LENGTH=309 /DNA_ID=CAMNT_0043230635 /DNA_START=71 /DNA_END=998 /DNA_ORIENTATION=-
MNKAKAMLDALMGPNRDNAATDRRDEWKDAKVCKRFLIGFCPYDKSVLGGRRSMEVCSGIHNEMLREAFKDHEDGDPNGRFVRQCEEKLIKDLSEAISKKDAYAKEQLAIKGAELKIRRSGPNKEIGRMKREAMELKEKADALEDADATQKEQLLKQHELALKEYEDYVKEVEKKEEENAPKASSCKVCGTAYATDDEYKAHLERKMHVAYAAVHAKADELKAKEEEREKSAATETEEKKSDREKKSSRKKDGSADDDDKKVKAQNEAEVVANGRKGETVARAKAVEEVAAEAVVEDVIETEVGDGKLM